MISGCGTSQRLKRFEYSQGVMGVKLKLVLLASDQETADYAALKATKRVRELDQKLSDYKPRSELNQLSARSSEGFLPVSEDLYRVLEESRKLSLLSDGAFDVTVGPLVQLWRKARGQGKLPNAGSIRRARSTVGYHLMKLVHGNVCLEAQGMRLDLGGIGKGFAAEAALEVLRSEGVPVALVELGGDIALGDKPEGSGGWRIGIDFSGRRHLVGSNQGVATSGDTEQFLEIDGVRYSHIVDPKTGIGLTNRCHVTVVAPDGTRADGLASALSAMGVSSGLSLIESLPGVEAAITEVTAAGVKYHATSGFQALLEPLEPDSAAGSEAHKDRFLEPTRE